MISFIDFLTERFFGKDKFRMMAYAIVIAEIYEVSPTVDGRVRGSYAASIKNIDKLYDRIVNKQGIKVERSAQDPYASDADMIKDIHKNKRIKVYTGHSDHPIYTPEQNIKFRVVHDMLSHYGPHKRSVVSNKVKFRGFDFTYPGEMDAYNVHRKFSEKAAHAAYFSEIVGQVSYAVITGNFGNQKVILFNEADHENIGVLTGKALHRQQYIYRQLKGGFEIENSPLKLSTKQIVNNAEFVSKAGKTI